MFFTQNKILLKHWSKGSWGHV